MASIIKRLWSGSDFWDKEENKQQRQQFIQDTKPTPGPSILSTVHNTINDTLNANTQADQQRRLSQGLPRYYQDQSNLSKITRAAETGGRVTARVLQGIGQDTLGAYDLLTPGHGTNRATKYYQNRGKETDQEVKDMGLDENVYKAGQVPLALGSYMIPGKAVSSAAKATQIAKVPQVVKLAGTLNKVPGVTKTIGALDDLAANGDRFQRITANLARSYTRPGNIADVGVDALQNAGHRTSLGQDNSAGTLALDAGMSLGMQGGMNLAGQGASAVVRAANTGIVQPTTRLVRNVANTVAPVQTTTKLIPRTGRLDLATSDALKAYNNMLVGADPNITGKVQSDLIARIQQIGKENGVDLTNGSVEQRMARVEAMLNGYLPQTQTGRQFVGKPLGEGGYAKNPFYRGDDVAGGLSKEQSEFINDYANMLEGMGAGNGVDITPDGRRISNNFRDADTAGRNMSKYDWFEKARKDIESGKAGFGASDDYKKLPGVKSSPLESLKQEVTRKKNYDEKPADYVVKYIQDNPEIKYNQQYADAIAKDLGDITPDQKSNLNTEVYLAQQEVRRLKEVERGKKLAQEGYQPLDPSKAKQIIQDAKDRGIKLEVVRKSDGILGTSESKNIYRPSIDADGNPFLMPKNNTRKGYRADDLTGDSPMYYREVGKTTKSVKPTYKDTIPGDEVVGRYRDGKTVKIGNKEYTVHKMSYGQYFAEPKGWQGGERDGFAPGTKWLYGKEDGTFDVVADDDFMRQGVIQREQPKDIKLTQPQPPKSTPVQPDPLESLKQEARKYKSELDELEKIKEQFVQKYGDTSQFSAKYADRYLKLRDELLPKAEDAIIETQGLKKVYHGTTHKWEGDFKEKDTFFTPNKKFAENVADEQVGNITEKLDTDTSPDGTSYYPTIVERYLPKDSKIFDATNKADIDLLANKLPENVKITTFIGGEANMPKSEVLDLLANDKNSWQLFEGEIKNIIRKNGYDGWKASEKGYESIGLFNPNNTLKKQQLTDLYNQATQSQPPKSTQAKPPTPFEQNLQTAGLAPQPTKGAKVSSDSQAKQTVRSSAPIEPSVSSRKTVSNQPQAAGTPQNAPQGNATSKAKQASRPVAKEIGTTQSVEKTTKARSQTTKATEQQSSQTKLAKRGEQELSVSYPDNTTNVVNKRGFTQSVKRSGEVSPTTQKNVSGEYNVRSTAKLAISADEFSKGNINKVTKEINSRLDVPTGKINDQDIADSIAVAKRLDAKGDFEQATQIYDKLAEHGTKGGQAIQAFSLLKNRSPDGLKFQAVKQLKKNGVKLTPVDERKLGTLIDGVRNTKPGSEARDRAIYNTFDFVSRKLPTSTPDKLVNLWRAGLLTAPRTTGGNILGNTTEALTREFWTNPVAVTTDKFFSLFTGKRTKTMAGGRAAGAKEGVARGIDYLKTGFDPRNTPNMKYDAPRRLNYKNKVVDTYVNGVYRWMGGQDQPFYYAAKAAAARDLAKADGINLGYKGKQLAEYVEKSVFDENWKPQTFKTAKDATEYGKYAVYQNETLLGSMAAGLKRGAKSKSKGGGALADFILPFTQVPSSVAMRIVDRTPIGMAKEVVSQIKNKSFDQRAMSEAIANGSFGIPVLGAGYALANSGLITGAYPTDSKERKLWEAEGKQPYSVRIGDKWYSLNYMQPFGTVLSMGKQVSDDIKEGKSQAEAWMNATAAAAKSIESQSFLQGINGLLSAVHDPQRSMQQYANSTVSGIVPNFVRAGAMAIDPNQRETKNVGDALKGAIPGVRQTLNTKLDMFGNDLPARDTPLNQYLNPLRPSKVRNQDDPLVGELRRLQNTDNGIIPTQFNRKSIGGVDLSNEQVRELNQKVNNAVQQVWGQAINDPRYNAMDDGEKKRTLDKLKDQIAENAKAQFVTDNGIQTTSKYNSKPVTFPSSSNSRTSYKEKYDNLVAEFNDPNNGWSDVQKVAKTKELKRLEIKKDYDADTVALHDMSKADMYAYVSKAKNGKQLAEKLIAYDNALYEAGLSQYRKYKNGIAPASKGGGRKSGGRGGKRKAIPKDLMAKAMDVPKVAQLRQSKITAKQPQARSFKTRRKAIPKIAKSTPKLTVKRTQTA